MPASDQLDRGTPVTWLLAPGRLELRRDEIAVWAVALDASQPDWTDPAGSLPAEECARAASFRFERDRRRFVVSHVALREILGRYLGAEPEALRFVAGPFGKPSLAGADLGRLHFNLAHAHELGLVAVARDREVGVDLEHRHDIADADRIVERYFTQAERAAYFGCPAAAREQAFFNGWTRKEAVLKATGEGLSRCPGSVEVLLADGDGSALASMDADPRKAMEWLLHAFIPMPEYVAALCGHGQDWHPTFWQWTGPA